MSSGFSLPLTCCGNLVKTKPLLEIVNYSWKKFLSFDAKTSETAMLQKHERTGRPSGKAVFIEKWLS
jgi:hypothetical protein